MPKCEPCDGEGVIMETCWECDGTGEVSDEDAERHVSQAELERLGQQRFTVVG